ncbi:hypothetical protein THIX_90004 [Thiomonas sp. X19]|uniref:hypothetical protein n=1 Tax=Thiomonas sp. X19 TaxID=1050370 RepID=UPI000B6E5554|nr:hypothetical protein [Thiomonas sp. X19]SCC95235.1 hypothetical protein THIX_90004 [Thiomonas sp. X19]
MKTTSAERMRAKRERDAQALAEGGDERELSDRALLEQIALSWTQARAHGKTGMVLALVKELARRIRAICKE